MAKSIRGISEQQVKETIEELVEVGEKPTTTKIRSRLGTGSFTTIGRVLQAWRAEQATLERVKAPEMPSALRKRCTRIWEEACRLADSMHEAERIGFHSEQERQRSEIRELENEVARLETLLTAGDEQIQDLKAKETQLRQQLVDQEQKLSHLSGRNESLVSELQRLQVEVTTSREQVAAMSERAVRAEAVLEQHQASETSQN